MNDQSIARQLRAMSQRLRERWESEDKEALKEQCERDIAGRDLSPLHNARVEVHRRAWKAAVVAGRLITESAAAGRWGEEAATAAAAEDGNADGSANNIFLKCAEYVVAKHMPESNWSQLCDRRVPAAYAEAMELMADELDGEAGKATTQNPVIQFTMPLSGDECMAEIALKVYEEGCRREILRGPGLPSWPKVAPALGTVLKLPFPTPRGEVESPVARVRDPRDKSCAFENRIADARRIRSVYGKCLKVFVEEDKRRGLKPPEWMDVRRLHLTCEGLLEPYRIEITALIDWVHRHKPDRGPEIAVIWEKQLQLKATPVTVTQSVRCDPAIKLKDHEAAEPVWGLVSQALLSLERAGQMPVRELVFVNGGWECRVEEPPVPPSRNGNSTEDGLTVTEAAEQLVDAIGELELELGDVDLHFDIGHAKAHVSAAATEGKLKSNGEKRSRRRIDPGACAIWVREFKAKERKKFLDAQD